MLFKILITFPVKACTVLVSCLMQSEMMQRLKHLRIFFLCKSNKMGAVLPGCFPSDNLGLHLGPKNCSFQ